MKTHLLERPMHEHTLKRNFGICGHWVENTTGNLSEVTCVHCLIVVERVRKEINAQKERK